MRGRGTLVLAAALLGLGSPAPALGDEAQVARGRDLFVTGCSACHGLDAHGIPGRGPDLHGAGAAAADFYLRTGRMPLDDPGNEPVRTHQHYPAADVDALVAYIGSLGGPPVPRVAADGSVSRGRHAFTTFCAGCHSVTARGGVVTGAAAPALVDATPTQVAEAVRIGPYVMPRFGPRLIDDRTLADLVAYVRLTQHPDDHGGLGVGHLGPVPEGLVAWLVAAVALLGVARLLGRRSEA